MKAGLAARAGRALPGPAIVAGLLAIVGATNRWMSWRGGALLVSATDETDYRRIALAAPHLPSGRMANQRAQLFALNWLVGVIRAGLGVRVEGLFRVVSLLVIVAICAVLWAALRSCGISTPLLAVCMAIFVLNTYSLRYYLLAPGYITDLTFVLSMAVISLGLVSERFWLILGGIALATLARQSALPVAVAITLLLWFTPPWRAAPRATRALRALAALAVPFALFAVLLAVSLPFSYSDTPGVKGLTLLGAVAALPSRSGTLLEHFARVANPLFAVFAALAVALLLRRRVLPGRPLRPPVIGCAVLGASVWLQAVVLNPSYSGHPERLAVLSLVPFVVALAFLLRDLQDAGMRLSAARAGAIVAILAAGSLHYLYTWAGPSTATEGGLLQLVAALAVGALLWTGLARERGRPAGSDRFRADFTRA